MARKTKKQPIVETPPDVPPDAQLPNVQPESVQLPNDASKTLLAKLFAKTNRGLLLDIFIFLMNLFLMRWLTRGFLDLTKDFSDDDELAGFVLLLFTLALFVLPPLGVTLKRWHYHQRLQAAGKTCAEPEGISIGCLFNPLFFFCLNLVIYSAINAFVMQDIYGGKEPDGAVFVSSILFGLILVIFQTIITYRYFSKPKASPPSEFMRSPRSETLGDICLFLNMLLFQILWNIVGLVDYPRVSSIEEFFGRLFLLVFIALMIYFPPRMFYLAEDIYRRRTWLTILLANSPIIFRVLIGNANW